MEINNNNPTAAYIEGCAGVIYKGKIYFTTFYPVGCLYSFDLKSKTTEFLKRFPVDNDNVMCHMGAVLHGNEAWFVANGVCRVLCVNLDTLETEFFDIPNHDYMNATGFVDYLIYDEDKLVMIPCGHALDTLMIVNMSDHSVESFFHVIPNKKCIGAYLHEDEIRFLSTDGKLIAVFNLTKRESVIVNREKDPVEWGFSSLVQGGSEVYLIPRDYGEIGVLRPESDELIRVSIPNPGCSYCGGLMLKEGLLMLGWRDDRGEIPTDSDGRQMTECVFLTLKDSSAREIRFPHGPVGRVQEYMTLVGEADGMHVIMGSDGNIFFVDDEAGIKEVIEYSIEADAELSTPIIERHFSFEVIKNVRNGMVIEDDYMSLETFVDTVAKNAGTWRE
ncbi:MAG: hypothetical protein K5840_04470 [Eubacterium sp.]|nr:hypothetical protein [Eubacterium sp.]